MIYFLRREEDASIKIGSTVNLASRLKQHRKEHADTTLTLLGITDGGVADEKALHRRFARLKTGSTPICEWFFPDSELLDYVASVVRPWTEADDSRLNITPNAVVVRGCVEWRDWLKRLAEHDRTNMAELLDRATADYARNTGFEEKAPKRQP